MFALLTRSATSGGYRASDPAPARPDAVYLEELQLDVKTDVTGSTYLGQVPATVSRLTSLAYSYATAAPCSYSALHFCSP